MQINIEQLPKLVEKADDVLLNPEGEKVILDLLAVRDQVDEAIEKAKAAIEMSALSLDPQWTGIKGDNITISYAPVGGARFTLEKGVDPKTLPNKLLKLQLDAKAVEQFVAEGNQLPEGVKQREITKAIRFIPRRTAND